MRKNTLAVLLFLSFLTAEAQRGIGTVSPDPSAVLELKSASKGFLPPRLTTAQRDAITLPVTGLTIFNSTKGCLEWYNGMVWYSGCGAQESSGGTAVVSSYNCTAASAGSLTEGTAVSGVTQTITAVAAAAGTYTISAAANGVIFSGSGIFSAPGTQDIVLTAEGTPLAAGTTAFALSTGPSCNFNRAVLADIPGPVGGNAICNGTRPTKVTDVISVTGKTWMDRNLGASRAAVSSVDYEAYGGLYQWGRGNDGHASIVWSSASTGVPVNSTTVVQSVTDTPLNALFITTGSGPYDWRSAKNDALWQGASGTNNPCPAGYRLPTSIELDNEIAAYSITNAAAAYSSPLKFTALGNRNFSSGSLSNMTTSGYYWSSTVNGTSAVERNFNNSSIGAGAIYRSFGFGVRCIKD